jgi:hypothetical protein
MLYYLIECPSTPGGSIHLLSFCPNCYESKGGLLIGTVSSNHKGKTTVECVMCGKTVDCYVEAAEGKVWSLESQEARGYPPKKFQTR